MGVNIDKNKIYILSRFPKISKISRNSGLFRYNSLNKIYKIIIYNLCSTLIDFIAVNIYQQI